MCAVTSFRVRRLPSVKRTPSRFYFVKSYPFLNPPSARCPSSENLPDRERLTHGNIYNTYFPTFALCSFLSNKKGVPKNTFFHHCFTHERSSLNEGFLPCIKIPTR